MATNRQVIIGITGKAGVGKSLASAHIAKHWCFQQTKFAHPLKAMLTALYESMGYGKGSIYRKIEGDLKEVPCAHLGGKTPRFAMQTLGTEWGRELFHSNFWVDAWAAQAAQYQLVVVDDVRFENEAAKIRELGGHIVHMYRSATARDGGSHPSEDGLTGEWEDELISNNSTPEELYAQLDQLVRSLISPQVEGIG